jgi:hypothetical protein
MTERPDLDLLELHRQLTDLADSAGPWDDPMPEVRRRVVMTPTPTRVPRRWLPAAVSPLTLGSAAAAVLVVVGAGWLIHGSGNDRKTSAASSQAAAAAGGRSAAPTARAIPYSQLSRLPAPHTTASNTQLRGTTAPGTTAPATPSVSGATPQPRGPEACVAGTVSSSLTLTAPSEIGAGARVQVAVRAGGTTQGSTPIVLVRSGAGVVGRLVPAAVVPRAHPTPPRRVDEAVTTIVGTLQRVAAVCGQSPARTVPAETPDALGSLPAGEYQLIAVSDLNGSFVLSAPTTIVVTR